MANGQAWRKRLPLAAIAITLIIVTAAVVIPIYIYLTALTNSKPFVCNNLNEVPIK